MKKAVSFVFLASISVTFGTDCEPTELFEWIQGLNETVPQVENCTKTLSISDTNVDPNGPDVMFVSKEMCGSDECKYMMQIINGVVDSAPDCTAASIPYKSYLDLGTAFLIGFWNELCPSNQVFARRLDSTTLCTEEQVQNIYKVIEKSSDWYDSLSACAAAANINNMDDFEPTDAVCGIPECKAFVEFPLNNVKDLPDCMLAINPKDLATKVYNEVLEDWEETCGEPPFSTAMTNTVGFFGTLVVSVSGLLATWVWL